jgi:fructose-bisphosphate aldolase class II
MPIVTLKEILQDAHEKRYGVAMFDVFNLEMIKAVIEAAEIEKSPIIVALAEVHVNSPRILEELAVIINTTARMATVPVCTHFDHGLHVENCLRIIHHGFSSVMFDGSALPYDENVKKTVEVVTTASLFGVSVEAELGHVGNAEGGAADNVEAALTDPAQTGDFVSKTGIDALAVSIGTAHGFYRSKPELDIERLADIRAVCPVPLVLHGGSGLSDNDFHNCIKAGISKINIYSEFVQAAADSIAVAINSGISGYQQLMRQSVDDMKKHVRQKLRLFESSGRA